MAMHIWSAWYQSIASPVLGRRSGSSCHVIQVNQAQSSPIKPNQTQSNPIKADSYLANACAAVGRPQLVPSTAWSSPIKANQGSSWEFPQKIAIKKNQSWKPNVSRNL
jgi:hypothetical protein